MTGARFRTDLLGRLSDDFDQLGQCETK